MGVTPSVSCQEEASRADEDGPREVQAKPTVDVIISVRGSVWPKVMSTPVQAMQRRPADESIVVALPSTATRC